MRVTQSMLSTNMLRNLNTSYGKMGKLQNQIDSGMKFTRASEDPVAAIKGMGYRTSLNKIEQFQRNIGEVNTWVDTTDATYGEVGDAVNRLRELLVQASNDTNTADDRDKIKTEVEQIREQIRDMGNTQVAGKYIFSGTNTQKPLFIDDGSGTGARVMNPNIIAPDGKVMMEVFEGVTFNVNSNGMPIFKGIDDTLGRAIEAIESDDSTAISEILGDGIGDPTDLTNISSIHSAILVSRAELGAKQQRVEMMDNRLATLNINITKQKSMNEDTDYAKAISDLTIAQSIHSAGLSIGAKIVQQTLVDFIR
ncbi:flagellar hook-associated protein FlgL [Caryophanon latum]|uniref:Flagellar hook-associated protein FlgL n=1 Tax=Caryophanon latum TaxID=33977 RepID=A0A1C0YI03_9BACL|nr:flagellar hook-associated protein FlgL [Caryophanon latum]OCS86806.1 flagellar hook-associated protein FlgL [Caryophanon latum]